jgi:hypothetical protein
MQNIKVFIDGKQVDLPTTDFILNMTYSLKDKNGIAINTGSRSEYSFEFPATNTNNQIFSRFWDIAEYTAPKQIFLDAYIEVNGMAFFQGKCQLTGVDIRPDLYYWQGKTYKVAFYGNNVDWTVQVGNKFLYEYDYGTHVYDSTTILTAITVNQYLGANYKYILIKWKDWATAGEVDIFEFTPALFIKTIIDKIFADINYTVISNFFSTPAFQKLVTPIPLQDKIYDPQYGIDYLNIQANDSQINYSSAPIYILPNQIITPSIGPNPYNNLTGDYTVPVTGYYLFTYSANITNITIAYGMTLLIVINGVAQPFVIGQYNLVGAQPYTVDTNLQGEQIFLLNAGDIVNLGGIAGGGGGGGTADVDINLQVIGEAQVISGLTIDFRYLINKTWNSLDFIRGLAHAFNLTFQTDVNNRIVTIEPSDTYLYQSSYPSVTNLQIGFYNGQTYDKTQSVDLDKEGEIFSVSEIQSQFCLSWQYDSNDPTLEAINAGAGLDLMQAQYVFPTNRFQSGQDIIENPFFSASLCIADNSIIIPNSLATFICPIIWSQNYLTNPTSTEANYDILPRIFTSETGLNFEAGEIYINIGFGPTAYAAPSTYMVNYNSLDGSFISLSFATETINTFIVKGLLERFYLLELIRLQSGKQVECYVFWNIVEIFNLDFRKLVKIHGDNYILQEVNSFNVALNRSTKTYLLNNYLGDGTEASQIQSSLLLSRLNA